MKDAAENGNPIAERDFRKFIDVHGRNAGLKQALFLSCGTGAEEPMLVSIFKNAPCSSVDVERFAPALKHFEIDRHNILRETLQKLTFIENNAHI